MGPFASSLWSQHSSAINVRRQAERRGTSSESLRTESGWKSYPLSITRAGVAGPFAGRDVELAPNGPVVWCSYSCSYRPPVYTHLQIFQVGTIPRRLLCYPFLLLLPTSKSQELTVVLRDLPIRQGTREEQDDQDDQAPIALDALASEHIPNREDRLAAIGPVAALRIFSTLIYSMLYCRFFRSD